MSKRKRSDSDLYNGLVSLIRSYQYGMIVYDVMIVSDVMKLFEQYKPSVLPVDAISESITVIEMKEQTLIRTNICYIGDQVITDRSFVRQLIDVLKATLSDQQELDELYEVRGSAAKHSKIAIDFSKLMI